MSHYETYDGMTREVPRPDLQEKAFRKYERDIAEAVFKQSIVVDPRPKRSARSYITRFKDACLAKRRYCYKSEHIPANFDLTMLKAVELEDGRVLIKNLAFGNAAKEATPPDTWEGLHIQDVERVKSFLAVLVKHNKGNPILPDSKYRVGYNNAAEREALVALAGQYNSLLTDFTPNAGGVEDAGDGLLFHNIFY